MEVPEEIYESIKGKSRLLITEGQQWIRELSSAKNYVCTSDLKDWTFGKSVKYDRGGGAAKLELYNYGFKNVLALSDQRIKDKYINSFLIWAAKVEGYPIGEKFKKDQLSNKRFELLVHQSLIDKDQNTSSNQQQESQRTFDEGFKKFIVNEVSTRDSQLTTFAKAIHGTICAVCDFDFGEYYGEHGEGFVEIHHLVPIAKGSRNTSLEDVRPVCSNCHRMLHRGNELLGIEQLKQIIENAKSVKFSNVQAST